jgi:predicted protein tyrosine phosphatase
VNHRRDQQSRPISAAIPAQRGRPSHDQVAADDRSVELLRAGRGADADDPVIRELARWRAAIVEGT